MIKSIKMGLVALFATLSLNMYSFNITQEAGEDYKIVSNEVKNGVRYISATPSEAVCSINIDIEIDVKSNTIQKVVYTRGCDGNAKGIGALIKGMKVDEAIKRLEGITCGKRPTSCPDQLAKILKQL